MNSLERRAEADLPDLVQYLDDALSLTGRLVPSIKYSKDDYLGFIIPAFLRKLEEQARSVQMLVFNDHGRDAELVARSMLETMISALWIARDPDRARQWQGYAYIEDWRLAEKRPDIPISPERRQAIDNFLLKYGKFYEDPHKRGKSDPYYNNWRCGVSIRQMSKEVEGDILYNELYGPFSDWIHAGPKSVGLAIERRGTTFKWNPAPPSVKATALCVSFQSIAEVLKIAVAHFHLNADIESEVSSLIEQYIQRFSV